MNTYCNIHPKAILGKNVEVGSFTTIENNVEIGEGTWIGPNVTLMSGTRIGKNCKVFPGAVIGAIPQDLKFSGEESLAIIGDFTTIRECVTINRGTKETGKTFIGTHNLIMAYSHIAHDCIVGSHCVFSNNSTLAGHIKIGNHVILAGLVAIHQFCSIGDYAFVGGGSKVRKDIPPYVKAAREPISYAGVNSVGLRRKGFSAEKIEEIQSIYRILFQNNLNTTNALRLIEVKQFDSPERDLILQFIKQSKRGLMKGYF
ncbi:MAG: acyl-ACP--UDP-N-acetylglucosamine O-acyltransferase [Flavobacteriaceae bacterium]